jgi:hypothetical protein
MDHLLLHCAYAYELWSFVLYLFGVSWVMPTRVIDVLAFWKERGGEGGGVSRMWQRVI